jgi:hypothetical protein
MGNKRVAAEMYRLGELHPEWDKELNRESLESEVGEILSSDKEILTRYKPSAIAREIEKRASKEKGIKGKPSIRTVLGSVSAVAAVLVLGLILPDLMKSPEPFSPTEIARIKGFSDSGLTVYRHKGTVTEVLNGETPARAKDLIQLGYSVSLEAPYGIIFSLDGRGVVTRHLVPMGDVAEKLTPGGEQLLTFSYELDDAPLFETFYLLTSDKPFPVEPLFDLITREAQSGNEIVDFPKIVKGSALTMEGVEKIWQYALSIPKED